VIGIKGVVDLRDNLGAGSLLRFPVPVIVKSIFLGSGLFGQSGLVLTGFIGIDDN